MRGSEQDAAIPRGMHAPAMKLTVAIPTHNRASTLRQTLASIASLELSGMDAECIVVDNASTDATSSVVEEMLHAAPTAIRRVLEARRGSSFARNRAIDEARGEFILFIDDDAVAEPHWALELIGQMERRGLDAACGMVLAQWGAPPPPWLGPRLYSKLAVHDPASSGNGSWERPGNYFSANAGFRRTAFERFGRFREDLGVVGSNPMSGEDTELFMRIMARGGKMGFAPRAIVHHLIGPERLTRAYLRRKSFAYGVGSAFAGGRSHNHLDKLMRNAVRMAAAWARGDQTGALYHQLECVNFFGYWRGRMMIRRAGGAQPLT
jgi:glycosyltransferase involved in cell wall biosynthesis